MNGMQQMLQNVKKLQREYEKAHKVLEEKEFVKDANGLVRVTLKGDFTLVKVEFLDDSSITKEDKEALEEALVIAYSSCKEDIMKEEDEIAARFQQAPGGMFF